MTNNSDGIEFFVSDSGDGFQLLDANGDVIAWTLDKFWAWRIVLALEFLRDHGCLNFLKTQNIDLPDKRGQE